MSQLLIIDVQKNFNSAFNHDFVERIKKESLNYSHVFYLWDNLNDENYYDQLPEEFLGEFNPETEEYDNNIYESFIPLTKQFGFFRWLMNLGYERELIVSFIKFMIENKVNDSRAILENPELFNDFKERFKNTSLEKINLKSDCLIIPDLKEDIQVINNGVKVCGGGRDACLEEVCLLLDALDIEYTIIDSLTY